MIYFAKIDGATTAKRKAELQAQFEQVLATWLVLKKQQLRRLALRTNKSQVEVFEAALDAYERELSETPRKKASTR